MCSCYDLYVHYCLQFFVFICGYKHVVLTFHVGATIFLLLFIWKFPFGPLLAVASDKGKMPIKGENSVISLDDLVAEKIGPECTSKFAEVDHPVNLTSASVQGNALCLPFLVFLAAIINI